MKRGSLHPSEVYVAEARRKFEDYRKSWRPYEDALIERASRPTVFGALMKGYEQGRAAAARQPATRYHCVSCGAPAEPGKCSYCKTPSAFAGLPAQSEVTSRTVIEIPAPGEQPERLWLGWVVSAVAFLPVLFIATCGHSPT